MEQTGEQSELERAYTLVEADLRSLNVAEVRLWREQFYLVDGQPVQVTLSLRGRGDQTGAVWSRPRDVYGLDLVSTVHLAREKAG